MNFDHIAFIVFIFLITLFLIFKRKKIELQKILFPFFYMILYRTNFGIKWMDKVSKKHKELIKLFGYSCIGFGFVGLLIISYAILYSMIKFFIKPRVTDIGMALVLPGTNIPGVGYLSFFYFIISILILAIVHEFAHGIVLRAHDLKVKSSGFAFLGILFPIVPAAFVEPNEKKLDKQKPSIQYSIYAAGPISNVLLAVFFLLIMLFVMAPIENKITENVGFTFDVTKNFPADKAGIKSGTVIESFNGVPVKDYYKFIEQLGYCTGPDKIVYLQSKDQNYKVTTTSHPEDKNKGYIGITNIKNKGEFKQGYENVGKVFFWFKGLFMWLYILNISIGLINLLPVYITDGAKMLLIAMKTSIKDQKKALKIWATINWLFVSLLIIGLVATYLKKFGLF
jgi:membrane-associated protease RseP (regulator of RpoE activity)